MMMMKLVRPALFRTSSRVEHGARLDCLQEDDGSRGGEGKCMCPVPDPDRRRRRLNVYYIKVNNYASCTAVTLHICIAAAHPQREREPREELLMGRGDGFEDGRKVN